MTYGTDNLAPARDSEIPPITLTILMTDWCNASCGHCCMNASPGRGNQLTLENIKAVIDNLRTQLSLGTVIFAGGEPTRRLPVLLEAIRHSNKSGVVTRLVSNAFWAKSKESCLDTLEKLNECGLQELNVSTDDYHLPYVPLTCIKNVWEMSKGMSFNAVVVANSVQSNSTINPGFLIEYLGESETAYHLEETPMRHTIKFNETNEQMFRAITYTGYQNIGRATDIISTERSEYKEKWDVFHPCPHALRDIALSAEGYLLACCGFEINSMNPLSLGNTNTEDALARLRDANTFSRAVASLGPHYIWKLLKFTGVNLCIPQKNPSGCEICQALTRHPDTLRKLKEIEEIWLPALNFAEHRAAGS